MAASPVSPMASVPSGSSSQTEPFRAPLIAPAAVRRPFSVPPLPLYLEGTNPLHLSERESERTFSAPPPPTQPAQSAYTAQCSHCQSLKSPLWRRGEHGQMLCNACGLYWRNHRTMRPLDFSLRLRAPSAATILPRNAALSIEARMQAIDSSRRLVDSAKCLRKLIQNAQNSSSNYGQLAAKNMQSAHKLPRKIAHPDRDENKVPEWASLESPVKFKVFVLSCIYLFIFFTLAIKRYVGW
jgi:GATA zinc finger